MAGTLGSYDGLQVTARRETDWSGVKVDVAASGVEVRTVFQAEPRYRYSIHIVAQDSTEVDDIVSLINDNYGSGDSWTMTDPVTASPVTVRLLSPLRLEQYRIPGWWMATIEAISVL